MIQGTIIRVAGPVVDVQFAAGRLPALQEALTVTAEGTERTMEVAQHVNESTVRCIMLSASEGLGKGMASLVISLCRYILFIMPLAWLLCRQLGPTGVWHAFWATEVLSAIIAFAVYRRGISKK